MLRLFIAIIIAFVVLMMQVLIKPYKTAFDNILGNVSAMMLVFVFMGTYALQADEADEVAILIGHDYCDPCHPARDSRLLLQQCS